jgi:Lon protease-like protein
MDRPATILELPIFPLNVVLFPGMPLPLHIFEERYKRMIARCLEGNRTFGVTLLREGRAEGPGGIPHEIGTVARIVRHVRMDDGRYNLVTRGVSRYQLLDTRNESGYLQAHVELLEEEEHDPHVLAVSRAIVEDEFDGFLDDLTELTGAQREPVVFPDDPTAASYLVAHFLPVYNWEKQRLLEASSTDARLAEERRILARERGMIREFGTAPAIYQVDDGTGPRLLQN